MSSKPIKPPIETIVVEGKLKSGIVLRDPVKEKIKSLVHGATDLRWVSLLVEVKYVEENTYSHKNTEGDLVDTILIAYKCLVDCTELTEPREHGLKKQYLVKGNLISSCKDLPTNLIQIDNESDTTMCLEMFGPGLDVFSMVRPFCRKGGQFISDKQFIWLPNCEFNFTYILRELLEEEESVIQVADQVRESDGGSIPVTVLSGGLQSTWHIS